jgi:hypothetical protein
LKNAAKDKGFCFLIPVAAVALVRRKTKIRQVKGMFGPQQYKAQGEALPDFIDVIVFRQYVLGRHLSLDEQRRVFSIAK